MGDALPCRGQPFLEFMQLLLHQVELILQRGRTGLTLVSRAVTFRHLGVHLHGLFFIHVR